MTVPVLLDDVTPLPGHVKWFAPWRWFAGMRPWKKWTVIVVALLAWYIESPVVIVPILDQRQVPMFEQVFAWFFYPLGICYEAFPTVQSFYDVQFEAVKAVRDSWD